MCHCIQPVVGPTLSANGVQSIRKKTDCCDYSDDGCNDFRRYLIIYVMVLVVVVVVLNSELKVMMKMIDFEDSDDHVEDDEDVNDGNYQ